MLVGRHLLLRFFRLLVAVTALLVAHPSTATVIVVERVTLVAGAKAIEAPSESEEREDGVDDARAPVASMASASADADSVRALTPLQSARAIRERAYLLHCALLR